MVELKAPEHAQVFKDFRGTTGTHSRAASINANAHKCGSRTRGFFFNIIN